MKEKIIKYYQKKHKEECEKTGQKIPQSLQGKKIRTIIKFINDIE